MRNPGMVYVVKMEYVSKINIFGLNMMVKSGLEKIFFVMYVHIINKTLSHKFHPYSIMSNKTKYEWVAYYVLKEFHHNPG